MYPIFFKIPGLDFPIRAFGFMVALGFLIGSHLFTRLAIAHEPDAVDERGRAEVAARYTAVTVWIIIGVLLGARLMYVLVEMARGTWVSEAPWDFLAIWKGGLAMYGGLAGGVVGGLWCAKRKGIRPIWALDLGLSAGFIGLGLGRIGCLLVGDDYGALVPEAFQSLPFPITLHVPEVLREQSLFGDENAGKILWATQIWMSVNAFALGVFGHWFVKRRRYSGQVSLWLVVLYALTRGVIESFRGDDVRGVWFDGALSTSQLIALVSGAAAAVVLLLMRKRREPEKTLRPRAHAGSS